METRVRLRYFVSYCRFVTEIAMFEYSSLYGKAFSPEATPEMSLTVNSLTNMFGKNGLKNKISLDLLENLHTS